VSRLLLPGWLGSVAAHLGGRPVAFAPDHNTLLVCPDDPEALEVLYPSIAKEYREATRALSPQAYTEGPDGRLVPYQVPPGHALYDEVARADVLLAATEYRAQGSWLEREHQRAGQDVFVATVLVGNRSDQPPVTIATWAEGVDTLLPRAQYVAFASSHAPPFVVPWPVVQQEVALRPVPGLDPPRYRLTGWPPPDAVDRLRRGAV
jgi:hypothetical protein